MTPWWRVPIVTDVAFVVLALADVFIELYWITPGYVAVALIGALGLLVRRQLPWLTLVLALPAIALTVGSIAALVAVYSITVRERRLWPPAAASVLVFAVLFEPWPGWYKPADAAFSIVYAIVMAAAPVAVGLLVRTRRELATRVRELETARRAEHDHERLEILTVERARIAREMHDVVSHQVSLIAVQAGALQVAITDTTARDTARTIRGIAANTLDELRQMVGVLRAPESAAIALAPQPNLADLDRLIAESGISATVRLDLPAALAPATQRTIFRTVQEALTNIRKHAPGAPALITGWTEGATIVVSITNPLTDEPLDKLPGGRAGIVGLRERAELLGGALLAHTYDNRFELVIRIPTERAVSRVP